VGGDGLREFGEMVDKRVVSVLAILYVSEHMFDMETAFDLCQREDARPVPVTDPMMVDLEWLPPGVLLAAALDRVDRDHLSGHDRVSVLKARARQIAHDQAELLADIQSVSEAVSELANLDHPDPQDVFYTTASESGLHFV
jgi:hypothetical protein